MWEANALTQYRLNRLLIIEHVVETRDPFGSVITDWQTLTEVWADKRPSSGKERYVNSAKVNQAIRATTWRILLGSGVDETMRVVDEARRVWNIKGIAEVGRRQFHDLICQSVGEGASFPGGHRRSQVGTTRRGRQARPTEARPLIWPNQ